MKFFKKIPWIAFWRFNLPLPQDSAVSRYIYDKKIKKLKPSCYEDANMGSISVFETQFMSERKVWLTGKKARPDRNTVYARCESVVKKIQEANIEENQEIEKLNLLVNRAPILKPTISWWHANIDNCPASQSRYQLMLLSLCDDEISKFIPNPSVKKNA